MTWSVVGPTAPGWYWLRFPDDAPAVVLVGRDLDDGLGVSFAGGGFSELRDLIRRGPVWAGPIPFPWEL